MSNHCRTKELSAYLDGESTHPERIRRHLEQCTQCAKQYDALVSLSHRIRTLTPPEPNEALVSQVLAKTKRHTPQAPFLSKRLIWGGLTAACLLVFVFIAYHDASTPSNHALKTATTFQENRPEPSILPLELEHRGSKITEEALFSTYLPAEKEEETNWIDVLASTDFLNAVVENLDTETDIEYEIDTLNEEESVVFLALLNEFLEQEWTT